MPHVTLSKDRLLEGRLLKAVGQVAEVSGNVYHAPRFYHKILAVGALKAAQDWLKPTKNGALPEGFEQLIALGRTDLSLEAHVLRHDMRQLFSDAELAEARRRMNIGRKLMAAQAAIVAASAQVTPIVES